MKALTLNQPWASFLVNEKYPGGPMIKQWETRGWQPRDVNLYQVQNKGFLIHASLRQPKYVKDLYRKKPFKDYLLQIANLPAGKIIGYARIGRILTTQEWIAIHQDHEGEARIDADTEFALGNYGPDRFAFEIIDAVQFRNQVSVPGMLNFWDFDERICLKCGCVETNCNACIRKTGTPCHWVEQNLCSACV